MKKGIAIVFVCVSILLLVSMPVVSAGLFNDFWDGIKNFFGGNDAGITGNPIDGDGCVDSDGGVYKNVQGTCIGGSEGGTDSCYSSSLVKEYYCLGSNVCGFTSLSCGTGWRCAGGECIPGSSGFCSGNPTVVCSNYGWGNAGCDGQEPLVCGDVPTGGWNCGPSGDDACASCSLIGDCEGLNQAQCSGISGCNWGSNDYVCGNNVVETGEQCDDGNTNNGDGCSSICLNEGGGPVCGNNVIETGEQCDDGNTNNGDGCSSSCLNEGGGPVCGNNVIETGEQCDDGNTNNGDGCSSICLTESGGGNCGDGVLQIEFGEQCDFGVDNGVNSGCNECVINNTGVCIGDINPPTPSCFSLDSQSDCVDVFECNWNSGSGVCENKPCSTWNNLAVPCYFLGCTWDVYDENGGENSCDDGSCLNSGNVIQDPTFEGNTLQAPYLVAAHGGLSFDNSQHHSGSRSLKHTVFGESSYTLPYHGEGSQLSFASEGDVWNSGIWVKSDSGNIPVQLRIFALDTSFSLLLSEGTPLIQGTATSVWQKISISRVMPEGTAYVSARVDNDGGINSIVYWDDWDLYRIIEGDGGEDPIPGCMDTLALNYNPQANTDDGNCEYNQENQIFGCTDDTSENFNPQANIDDGSCEYSEECNGEDDNENGMIDEGCVNYSINNLIFYSNEVWEDVKIPVLCKFEIMNLTNNQQISNVNVSETCIRASVNNNFTACSILLDGVNSGGLPYRSFNCDVGSIGENKEIRCSVNPSLGPSCNPGLNASSEIGLVNVTTPLVCPSNLQDIGFVEAEPSLTLEGMNLTSEQDLSFDWKLTNLVPSNELEVIAEAGLYEINEKEKISFDSNNVLLDSSSKNISFLLNVPPTVSDGDYRIYIKTTNINEDQFCMLDRYNVNVEVLGTDSSGVHVDFRYLSSKSIEISSGETITFTLNGVDTHSIKLESIFENVANLIVQSNPINISLSEGENVKVDLEGDGIKDIRIILTQITGNSIIINLEALEFFETCITGQIRDCGSNNEGTQFCINGVWEECGYDYFGGSNENFEDYGYSDSGENNQSFPWVVILVVAIIIAIFFILIIISKRKFDKKISDKRPDFLQMGQGPSSRGSPPGQLIMRRPGIRRSNGRRPDGRR